VARKNLFSINICQRKLLFPNQYPFNRCVIVSFVKIEEKIMYLLKNPSKVIGWGLFTITVIASFFSKFTDEYVNVLIYLYVFWFGVLVAEKWCEKKVDAERFYSAFYQNGEHLSEKVRMITLHKDTYFHFWIAHKIILLLSVVVGYLMMHFGEQNELLNTMHQYVIKNHPFFGMFFLLSWMAVIGLTVVFSNWILNRAFTLLISKNAESKERYNEYAEFGNLYFNHKQREEERKLLIKK
jgi:hypothetical protein